MKKRILSLSRQSYRDLRKSNCIYVDKTKYIHKLCTEGKMYFLSRPRRFGKSLLLSTFEELFKGSQDLFEDTWIADKWDWTETNPILNISFNLVDYEEHGLNEGLRRMLMETPTHIYIFEFKINGTAEIAFQQIIDKKYAVPFSADSRVKIGIGVNFNSVTRQLEGWKNDFL